ncbi:NAD(P)/FAD-dependent oxidoreductase [Vallitalea okinawensis]|uniref:NAD(P)/FAD-dependent oxidoreductase n=1 Tax=Vallitalea okinawensis TaxID=2078660 RepID=UPI000CFDF61D|nr:NAD(P)/FAD-dependent oxidoreductase [Vallitalea okinawensis]
MSKRYDIAIVGSGPAGLQAALNAQIRKKSFILFGSKDLSKMITKAPQVNNYLGLPSITGEELKDKYTEHLDDMGIQVTEDKINSVFSMGDYYILTGNDNKMYEANSVIIATGISFGKPYKGEEDFLGKGVGYCATCDAPLYKDKVVTIIGQHKEAEEEANYVSELASKVYYLPLYKDQYNLNDKVEIIEGRPVEIKGDIKINKLVTTEDEIETDGLFILRESISPGQLVPGLKMDGKHIKVNQDMETNLQGLFAAGDITGKPYGYIRAAGQGYVASLNAVNYVKSA